MPARAGRLGGPGANYIATFLERDLGRLGYRPPAAQMRRFWTMLAQYHAQTWNGSELARALGVSQPTTRRYLDALTDALVVRQLQPRYANVGKRVVALSQGVAARGTHSGAELDLFFVRDGRNVGVEVKRADAPRVTPSMRTATTDLQLADLYVLYPGRERYTMAPGIEALPVAQTRRRPRSMTRPGSAETGSRHKAITRNCQIPHSDSSARTDTQCIGIESTRGT